MLTAFIQHGHDDRDTLGFASHGGDDPLQVGEMLIRTHRDPTAEHLIFNIVGTGVTENVHIVTADALFDHALGFTVAETGTGYIDQEVLSFRTGGGAHIAGH